MSGKVEPEEVEALMGLLGEDQLAAAQVADRDLEEPCRLSAEGRDAIERRLQEALPDLESFLGERLQCECSAEIGGVRELHADKIAAQLEEPLAVLRFRVAGQPGWLVWQNAVAIAAIETLLGSPGKVGDPRPFTRIERQVLARILSGAADVLLRAVGASSTDAEMVEGLRGLGSWRDAGDGADAHRLAVDLTLRGIGDEPSELQVYLPGIHDTTSPAAPGAEPATLPDHLDEVTVDLVVTLGETEIPLSQLLEIEEGDVIPLGTPHDGLLSLSIDGWEFAKARLGRGNGQVTLATIEKHATTPDDPETQP